MLGWNTPLGGPSYNFLTIPGGGALAGFFVGGVGAGPGCAGGAVVGLFGGVYLGYLGASRGTLPPRRKICHRRISCLDNSAACRGWHGV